MAASSRISWRTAVLAASSVSFAVATVLDLAEVSGFWRVVGVVLSALGFVTLGVSTVAAWIAEHRLRARDREGATATLSVGDPPSEPAAVQLLPTRPQASHEPPPDRARAAWSQGRRLRLAGVQDLARISQAGKNFLGDGFFYDVEELESYTRTQRDSIWCLTDSDGELGGYAILLALKPLTVERIKSGDIALGRHILSSDIEDSIDNTDAVYLAMVHGFSATAGKELGAAVLQRVMSSHDKRRPQLVLARRGTSEGGLRMDTLGFERFGNAPFIEATYTDAPHFEAEIERRNRLQLRLAARAARE